MEREIRVVVRVSDHEHARLIRQDIISAVKNRTSIYAVEDPIQGTDMLRILASSTGITDED